MRLETTLMAANKVEPDCFIYLEDEARFFYVDDIDHNGNYCIFYFEEGISETGLDECTLTFHKNKKLIIYDPYVNQHQSLSKRHSSRKNLHFKERKEVLIHLRNRPQRT